MSFFHLKSVPGCHWPPLPDAAFALVWNAYLELDRTQWLPPTVIQERQLQQVRTLLDHCIRHVPYYREVLPAAGIVPAAVQTFEDFRRVPLLPRRIYQEQSGAFVATALPAGTVADGVQTNWTQLWWHALYLRDLEWCNLDPAGTLAMVRATETSGAQHERLMQGITLPCWSAALDPLIETGLAHLMDVQQDPHAQMQWLRRVAPDYLVSSPANLEALAGQAREQGPLPRLRAIQSLSGTLTSAAQAVIAAAFSVPVKNTYSDPMLGYLASPCPEGHGLHVHAENVLLEVLDESGQACAPGQPGRLIATDLHNLRAPLVRYELGDEATVGPTACPCGRGLPVLTAVG